MIPVENAPIRKYFKEASLLLRFFFSLPVRIYKGMDMISILRNSMRRLLKEEARETPQRTKNIREKYSATSTPTDSMSLALSKRYKNVHPKATVLYRRPKLLKASIPWVSILNIWYPCSSATFKINNRNIPRMARFLTTPVLEKRIPLNIINTPQTAEKMIAFIYCLRLHCYLIKTAYFRISFTK
jgi:hypothetical protein